MVGLGFLAYFHPVQLGPIADPANTKFVPRPEWYYLPMFEWLKFWSSRMEVFAVILIPGILALLFFLMPFLDRKLERRPWRRPIPLLAVAIVLVGMIFLGFKSHLDDLRDHAVAVQLAFQEKQAEDYTRAPFKARMESASRGTCNLGARQSSGCQRKGNLRFQRLFRMPRSIGYGNGGGPQPRGDHKQISAAATYRLSSPSQCEDARRSYAFIRFVHGRDDGPFQLSWQSGKQWRRCAFGDTRRDTTRTGGHCNTSCFCRQGIQRETSYR